MNSDLDGMAAVVDGVLSQAFPHTVDARVWADEFEKTLMEHPGIANDKGAMIGWFANAIMAGYDTAMMRDRQP